MPQITGNTAKKSTLLFTIQPSVAVILTPTADVASFICFDRFSTLGLSTITAVVRVTNTSGVNCSLFCGLVPADLNSRQVATRCGTTIIIPNNFASSPSIANRAHFIMSDISEGVQTPSVLSGSVSGTLSTLPGAQPIVYRTTAPLFGIGYGLLTPVMSVVMQNLETAVGSDLTINTVEIYGC